LFFFFGIRYRYHLATLYPATQRSVYIVHTYIKA
jgi:hypothetical protein